MAHDFLQNFVYTKTVTTKFQAWHKLSDNDKTTIFDISETTQLDFT